MADKPETPESLKDETYLVIPDLLSENDGRSRILDSLRSLDPADPASIETVIANLEIYFLLRHPEDEESFASFRRFRSEFSNLGKEQKPAWQKPAASNKPEWEVCAIAVVTAIATVELWYLDDRQSYEHRADTLRALGVSPPASLEDWANNNRKKNTKASILFEQTLLGLMNAMPNEREPGISMNSKKEIAHRESYRDCMPLNEEEIKESIDFCLRGLKAGTPGIAFLGRGLSYLHGQPIVIFAERLLQDKMEKKERSA